MDTSKSTCNSDLEEEEEDILVYADFDSVLDERLIQSNTLFKVIALDSDEPFIQIGSQMYSGKWLDSVGTHIFFEPETNSEPTPDPVFSDIPNPILNYKLKTRKCLGLSRVFINKKQDDQNNEVINSLPSSDVPSGSKITGNETDNMECGNEKVSENG